MVKRKTTKNNKSKKFYISAKIIEIIYPTWVESEGLITFLRGMSYGAYKIVVKYHDEKIKGKHTHVALWTREKPKYHKDQFIYNGITPSIFKRIIGGKSKKLEDKFFTYLKYLCDGHDLEDDKHYYHYKCPYEDLKTWLDRQSRNKNDVLAFALDQFIEGKTENDFYLDFTSHEKILYIEKRHLVMSALQKHNSIMEKQNVTKTLENLLEYTMSQAQSEDPTNSIDMESVLVCESDSPDSDLDSFSEAEREFLKDHCWHCKQYLKNPDRRMCPYCVDD